MDMLMDMLMPVMLMDMLMDIQESDTAVQEQDAPGSCCNETFL